MEKLLDSQEEGGALNESRLGLTIAKVADKDGADPLNNLTCLVHVSYSKSKGEEGWTCHSWRPIVPLVIFIAHRNVVLIEVVDHCVGISN